MESTTATTPNAAPGSPTTRSIVALKQRAAVLEVSRAVPNSSSLHVPRSALCLDRASLAEQLEDIIAEKQQEWDVFQQIRIVQRRDESGLPVARLVNGAQTTESADDCDGESGTSQDVNADSGAGKSHAARRIGVGVKFTSRMNFDNTSAPALRLKGLRSGPLAHVMGLYLPCQSESGLVLHNGQVLYRLRRKHLSLQTEIEGPQIYLAFHKVKHCVAQDEGRGVRSELAGLRWCVVHEFQLQKAMAARPLLVCAPSEDKLVARRVPRNPLGEVNAGAWISYPSSVHDFSNTGTDDLTSGNSAQLETSSTADNAEEGRVGELAYKRPWRVNMKPAFPLRRTTRRVKGAAARTGRGRWAGSRLPNVQLCEEKSQRRGAKPRTSRRGAKSTTRGQKRQHVAATETSVQLDGLGAIAVAIGVFVGDLERSATTLQDLHNDPSTPAEVKSAAQETHATNQKIVESLAIDSSVLLLDRFVNGCTCALESLGRSSPFSPPLEPDEEPLPRRLSQNVGTYRLGSPFAKQREIESNIAALQRSAMTKRLTSTSSGFRRGRDAGPGVTRSGGVSYQTKGGLRPSTAPEPSTNAQSSGDSVGEAWQGGTRQDKSSTRRGKKLTKKDKKLMPRTLIGKSAKHGWSVAKVAGAPNMAGIEADDAKEEGRIAEHHHQRDTERVVDNGTGVESSIGTDGELSKKHNDREASSAVGKHATVDNADQAQGEGELPEALEVESTPMFDRDSSSRRTVAPGGSTSHLGNEMDPDGDSQGVITGRQEGVSTAAAANASSFGMRGDERNPSIQAFVGNGTGKRQAQRQAQVQQADTIHEGRIDVSAAARQRQARARLNHKRAQADRLLRNGGRVSFSQRLRNKITQQQRKV